MNKFIFALAAIALVGAVSASPVVDDEQMTQLAVFPADDQELAGLKADKQMFRDFCITARDEVQKYLKSGMNNKVSQVYRMVAESFATATTNVGQETGKAAEQGQKTLAENAYLAKSVFGQITASFKGAASAEFLTRLAALKAQLKGENLVDVVKGSCSNVVFDLKPTILSLFRDTKKELIASGADAEIVQEAALSNLGCATMSRLMVVANSCEFVQGVIPTIAKLMNKAATEEQ